MSETVTMTLTDFLLARIAEDEAHNAMVRHSAPSLTRPGWKRADAECQAKRRIVEHMHRVDELDVMEPGEWKEYNVLMLLALPYADHPDYRAEWRP